MPMTQYGLQRRTSFTTLANPSLSHEGHCLLTLIGA